MEPRDFNCYGARRGNHEVMVRGTFANIRLRNRLAGGARAATRAICRRGEQMTIYAAAQRYAAERVPLVAIAGREYGSGSSRDWAAKGTALLGIRAVIARASSASIAPTWWRSGSSRCSSCQGESAESLGLDGTETYTIRGLATLDVGST